MPEYNFAFLADRRNQVLIGADLLLIVLCVLGAVLLPVGPAVLSALIGVVTVTLLSIALRQACRAPRSGL